MMLYAEIASGVGGLHRTINISGSENNKKRDSSVLIESK